MLDWQDIDAKITSNSYFSKMEYHDTFRMMRKEDPVHWVEDRGYGRPLWMITRYEDIVAVLSDTVTFSSKYGGTLPPDPNQVFTIDQYAAGYGSNPTFVDPPRHTQLRVPFNRHFTVPAIGRMASTITALTKDIIDEVAPLGSCDMVSDIAAQLPTRLICEMMGVPREDWKLMVSYTNAFMASTDPEFRREGLSQSESQLAAQSDLYNYVTALALEKRKNPGDDFSSLIATMKTEGQLWEERDVGWWCFSMIAAGLETTRNAISAAMLAFIGHADQAAAALRADPSLMPKAVEEILRFFTPGKHILRVATCDTDLRGKKIRKDDWLVLWLASANRDEFVFSDPDCFDIARDPNPHLSFSVNSSPHFCLGRNLSRLEMKIMLRELLRRLPDMEMNGDVEWIASSNVAGLKRMPVKYESRDSI